MTDQSPTASDRPPAPGGQPPPAIQPPPATRQPPAPPPAVHTPPPVGETEAEASGLAVTIREKPEIAVGGAFAGGLVLALILKRLVR